MAYLVSQQFPIGTVIQRILDAFDERSWRIPWVTWENSPRGDLWRIGGDDWGITFLGGHPLEPWEVAIKGKELHLFTDESGPRFYYYVGEDWEADRKKFLLSTKVNSKLRSHSRMYLMYKGAFYLPGHPRASITYPGRRPPYLVPNNDLGREYDPGPNDPPYFTTAEVFADLASWLEQNVLAKL